MVLRENLGFGRRRFGAVFGFGVDVRRPPPFWVWMPSPRTPVCRRAIGRSKAGAARALVALGGNVRFRMVNGLLRCAGQGGKICRVHGFAGLNLPGRAPRHFHNSLIYRSFSVWHAACNGLGEPQAWESARRNRRAAAWECGHSFGRGACGMENLALIGTVTADRAASRARGRRQQHREPGHHRLQGRRLGVPRIPDAGRPPWRTSRAPTSA